MQTGLASELDVVMNDSWRPLNVKDVDGWRVRVSQGVTNRANSVLPLSAPRDFENSLRQVEAQYRAHGLKPIFQISPSASPSNLDKLLAERGYEVANPTRVQAVATKNGLENIGPPSSPITVRDFPDDAWLELWWRVDGRGDKATSEIARQIMCSSPALYVSITNGDEVVATGRLAISEHWGGISCVAVHPSARRRGYGSEATRALLDQARKLFISHVWLQVTSANQAALSLYEKAGFTDISSYHYRVST